MTNGFHNRCSKMMEKKVCHNKYFLFLEGWGLLKCVCYRDRSLISFILVPSLSFPDRGKWEQGMFRYQRPNCEIPVHPGEFTSGPSKVMPSFQVSRDSSECISRLVLWDHSDFREQPLSVSSYSIANANVLLNNDRINIHHVLKHLEGLSRTIGNKQHLESYSIRHWYCSTV